MNIHSSCENKERAKVEVCRVNNSAGANLQEENQNILHQKRCTAKMDLREVFSVPCVVYEPARVHRAQQWSGQGGRCSRVQPAAFAARHGALLGAGQGGNTRWCGLRGGGKSAVGERAARWGPAQSKGRPCTGRN